MNFLIVGLGSMGKRRIRCLQALGNHSIHGLDPREDRRKEAQRKYGITSGANLAAVDVQKMDAIVISTPPDRHLRFLEYAVDHGKPSFVEASVILRGLPELRRKAERKHVLVAPSCTMRFHQAIRTIKAIVSEQRFGKVSNFSYHCGQFLPDWHPWERVEEFYVSKKATGGAREIVPFELTWLVDVFGHPDAIQGYRARTVEVGAPIDDSYAVAMRFRDAVGTMVIDVTSRFATRSLILNLEGAQVVWNWEDPFIRIFNARMKKWTKEHYTMGRANKGYNKNISEDMYIDEIESFLRAIRYREKFPNTLRDDIRVLKLLKTIEAGKQ